MAALVAGALAQFGDRPAWLAAILADRWHRRAAVIAAAALALGLAGGIAAALAMPLARRMTPEAAQLILAVALLLQAGGGVVPAKPPERLDGWRLGAFGTAALGLFILCFGDGLQFVVLALAMRTPMPALAALGATAGGLAVIAPAALAGERAWMHLPHRMLRLGASALFGLAGVVLALEALRLV